ncbi:hypothetical protein [Prescottella equi]|uniref:hypothetical protein n=1 Tax=Rhodococcus hoagii TaxID=43767 RepID=UPI001C75D2C4|nr:hypothetical protein [Prescottella equi]BCN44694.1 hypothetical protein RE9414_29740 [Prescottella equi]
MVCDVVAVPKPVLVAPPAPAVAPVAVVPISTTAVHHDDHSGGGATGLVVAVAAAVVALVRR